MTSDAFHLVMLAIVGSISLLSCYGYRFEPCEHRTALKYNAVAGVWFLYIFWNGPPVFIEASFERAGFFVLSLVLAVNARRVLLGAEYLFVRHWAAAPIASALRSGGEIDAGTTARLGDRTADCFIPGLRIFVNRRKAEQAQALREKVQADALLKEAIVRRERAREEAELVRMRRRAALDAWRKASKPRLRSSGGRRRVRRDETWGASL